MYRAHCQRILDAIVRTNFREVRGQTVLQCMAIYLSTNPLAMLIRCILPVWVHLVKWSHKLYYKKCELEAACKLYRRSQSLQNFTDCWPLDCIQQQMWQDVHWKLPVPCTATIVKLLVYPTTLRGTGYMCAIVVLLFCTSPIRLCQVFLEYSYSKELSV